MTWLDTETKAMLQPSPPEKQAPPDTATFGLVLLALQNEGGPGLAETVERIRQCPREEAARILAQPLPVVLKRGLSLEDALIGQFELIACDAVSVFLADDVLEEASRSLASGFFISPETPACRRRG